MALICFLPCVTKSAAAVIDIAGVLGRGVAVWVGVLGAGLLGLGVGVFADVATGRCV